jgi:hypothetical protein
MTYAMINNNSSYRREKKKIWGFFASSWLSLLSTAPRLRGTSNFDAMHYQQQETLPVPRLSQTGRTRRVTVHPHPHPHHSTPTHMSV